MADKPKREAVVPEMRERLLVNRTGKLTSSQWLDLVMQPLTALLVLMAPLALIMPRFFAFGLKGLLFVGLVTLAVMAVTLLFRAYRYARAPVRVSTLYARSSLAPVWTFWRAVTLYDETGRAVRFGKRLAPPVRLGRDQAYLVYYLQEPGDNVLLSLAPVDHPDAAQWQPDAAFAQRFARRAGSQPR